MRRPSGAGLLAGQLVGRDRRRAEAIEFGQSEALSGADAPGQAYDDPRSSFFLH
jgi:hypothetical protein